MNGLGSLFQCSAQTVMAGVRLSIEVNTAQAFVGQFLEPPLHQIEQELEVGMKCRCQRRRLLCANHCRTSGALCADRLSRMTCTDRPFATVASICLKNANTSVPACPFRRWVCTSPVPMFIAASRSIVPCRL